MKSSWHFGDQCVISCPQCGAAIPMWKLRVVRVVLVFYLIGLIALFLYLVIKSLRHRDELTGEELVMIGVGTFVVIGLGLIGYLFLRPIAAGRTCPKCLGRLAQGPE